MKKLFTALALFVFAGAASAQMAEVSVSGGVSALSNKVLGSVSGAAAGVDEHLAALLAGHHLAVAAVLLHDVAQLLEDGGQVHDRLVAVVEGVQAVGAVHAESVLRRAEDRDAPAARAGESQKGADELGEALGRADRIPRDDRDAAGAVPHH